MIKVMTKTDKRISNQIIADYSKIYFDKKIFTQKNISRDLTVEFCVAHNNSILNTIQLLGLKRGLKPQQIEIARIAALLHDTYTLKTGLLNGHAEKSADEARAFLKKYGFLKPDEKILIENAIRKHSEKNMDSKNWLVELLKDADILDCYTHSKTFYKKNTPHYERLKKIMAEFKMKKY